MSTLTSPPGLAEEAASIAARRPDSIRPGYRDGRDALIGIARAHAHTPRHLPVRDSLNDPAVHAVTGRFTALHGLLTVAALTDPETIQDHMEGIDRAQHLLEGDDPTTAHAICCNDECGCTRPGRTGQPAGDLCEDCLTGLAAYRDDKVEQLVCFLADLFTVEAVAMAVVL